MSPAHALSPLSEPETMSTPAVTVAVISYDGKIYLNEQHGRLHPFSTGAPALRADGVARQESVDDRQRNGRVRRILLYEATSAPEGAMPCDPALLRTGPTGGLPTSDFFKYITQDTIKSLARLVVHKHVVLVKGCSYFQQNVLACRVAKQEQDTNAGKPLHVKIHRADRKTSRGAKRVIFKTASGVEMVLGSIPREFTKRVRAGTLAKVVGFHEYRGVWSVRIEATILRR